MTVPGSVHFVQPKLPSAAVAQPPSVVKYMAPVHVLALRQPRVTVARAPWSSYTIVSKHVSSDEGQAV